MPALDHGRALLRLHLEPLLQALVHHGCRRERAKKRSMVRKKEVPCSVFTKWWKGVVIAKLDVTIG
jgi:hypothetical protein